MKIRTLIALTCLGSLVPRPLAAQDQPKRGAAHGPKGKAVDTDDGPSAKKDEKPDAAAKPREQHPAAVSTLTSDELAGFDEYPQEMRKLVEQALALTRLNLAYTFGGSAPEEGGMDCSGTIHYLLAEHGLKDVPRSSDEICQWVRERSGMHLAPDGVELSHDAFSALRPGDLLFWTGTYETLPRKLPVSHIMMYLGTLKKTGKPVVFGASDGRYYAGQRRSGVSVFDFSMPRTGSKAAFYGYGTIPGLARAWAKEEIRKGQPPEKAAREIALATKPMKKPESDDDVDALPPSKSPKAVAKEDDSPSPKTKVKAAGDSSTATKTDDEAPKKEPAPHKPATHRKSTVKKKPASDDNDPGAVMRKAVNSIRKAFE